MRPADGIQNLGWKGNSLWDVVVAGGVLVGGGEAVVADGVLIQSSCCISLFIQLIQTLTLQKISECKLHSGLCLLLPSPIESV